MKFSLVIHSPPSSQTSYSAYRFAETLLAQGHSLYRVFFYHDGAYQGLASASPISGEVNIAQRWQALAKQYAVDLVVCVAAGVKRGVLDDDEAKRHQQAKTLQAPMVLSGLGQLADATAHSDRVITFGA